MTAFGVSGPRHLFERQERLVADWILDQLLDAYPPATEFTSGCAEGVDSIGVAAAERARIPLIRLTVPCERAPAEPEVFRVLSCNYALIERGKHEGWEIIYCPPGLGNKGYLLRDDVTVAHSEVLLATPKTPREEKSGSGTWATIRRGLKAGIEVRCFPLDGSKAFKPSSLAR